MGRNHNETNNSKNMSNQPITGLSVGVVDALVALGAKQTPIWSGGGSDELIVIPQNQKVESLAKFFPPKRIEQQPSFLETGSFTAYVKRFKTENTLVFANVTETGADFTAVLDYHGAAPELNPDYCRHVARFSAVETPEWKVWKQYNRKAMNQVEFAVFLEDNASLFVDPSGAELLELVRSLHGHRNARFNTALRLDNGAYSVSYDEEVVVKGSAQARSGDMELPPIIKAGVAVFQGGQPYEVVARLKSRVEERKLSLFYETVALHVIIRESILAIVKQIAEETGIVPLLGNPGGL